MSKAARSLNILSKEVLSEQVAQLNSSFTTRWIVENSGSSTLLTSSFKFKSFPITWKFLNNIVIPANTLRHHPTITTTYNKVKIDLTTHDVGNQITLLDLSLAEMISKTYLEFEARELRVVPTVQETPKKPISLIDASKIINDLVQQLSQPNRG